MVFAEAFEPDVLDEKHLVVLLGEPLLQVNPGVLMKALEDLGIHACDAVGSVTQAFTVGIFADGFEDLTDRAANPFLVDAPIRRAGGFGRGVEVVASSSAQQGGLVQGIGFWSWSASSSRP